MKLPYFGGAFDGHKTEHATDSTVSIKPISEVHIGNAGGATNIQSVDEAVRIVGEPTKYWAVYVLDTRNGLHGYHHLMNITAAEFELLAGDTFGTLKAAAESRGLNHPF